MRHRIALGLVSLSVSALLAGCGGQSSGPESANRSTVTGKVTLDGTPIEKGTISFSSKADVEVGEPPGSGPITNGTYSVQATPGKKQVSISVRKESGPKDATGVAPTEEVVPAKFNTATTLEADIKAEGENTFDFDLKS